MHSWEFCEFAYRYTHPSLIPSPVIIHEQTVYTRYLTANNEEKYESGKWMNLHLYRCYLLKYTSSESKV